MINKIKLLSLVIVTLFFSLVTIAQTPMAYLQSDRNCYVSGDMVFIKIYLFDPSLDNTEATAVYADISSSNGTFISGEILTIQHNLATGYIAIPDTLTTGHYLCRVYTEYSKTLTNPVIGQKSIYVSNRFGKNEPLYNLSVSEFDKDTPNDSVFSDLKCVVSTQSDTIPIRNRVHCRIKFDVPFSKGDSLFASISVIPVSKYEKIMALKNQNPNHYNGIKLKGNNGLYNKTIPSGIKLSGKVIDKVTGNSISNSVVFLSFPDSVLRVKYAITDSLGNFDFYLANLYGYHETYLTAFSYPALAPIKNAVINLTPLFLSNSNQLNTNSEIVGYLPSPDSLNVIKSVISKAYQLSNIEYKNQPLRDTFLFEYKYLIGSQNNTINIDDYVDLPDFIEISKEILPIVRYKKEDGVYRFSVMDGPNNVIRHNPLVFVDGIPLIDNDKIMSWGSDKIKTIETRSEPRVWGDILFENGIISVQTKKNNFWSLTTNISNKVVPLQAYQKPVNYVFAKYNERQSYYRPDFRQTLYWNPNLTIADSNVYELDFYASDETGWFVIVFEGISKDGSTVSCRKLFYVK